MKKIILLIVFLLSLIFTYTFKPTFNEILLLDNVIFSDAEYSVYCLNISDVLKNSSDIKLIDNGNSFIVKSDINFAKYIKQNCSNILGESICFKSNMFAIEKIKNLYDIDFKIFEEVDDIKTYYGYSNFNYFNQNVLIDSEIINIELAYKNEILTIGTPIILGDY